MDTKTTLSISEARKKIFDIAKNVQKYNKYYTLTEKGRPKAVIMSAEEFESWAETLEVMKDFPDLKKDVKEARKDFASGRYKKYTTLEEILKKEGYVMAHQPNADHEISSQSKTTGRKRTRKTS